MGLSDGGLVDAPDTAFVVGREGRPASWWFEDLAGLCAAFKGMAAGLYWIQLVHVEPGAALEDMRSDGDRDWGFIRIRPAGGWILGTPGLRTAAEESAALAEIGGRR